jgi:hypothetical protein
MQEISRQQLFNKGTAAQPDEMTKTVMNKVSRLSTHFVNYCTLAFEFEKSVRAQWLINIELNHQLSDIMRSEHKQK